jgi:hypothetical protein
VDSVSRRPPHRFPHRRRVGEHALVPGLAAAVLVCALRPGIAIHLRVVQRRGFPEPRGGAGVIEDLRKAARHEADIGWLLEKPEERRA